MVALILSDSHGNIEMMREAVDRTGPDVILHLGDCWNDADRLQLLYPDIPIHHQGIKAGHVIKEVYDFGNIHNVTPAASFDQRIYEAIFKISS